MVDRVVETLRTDSAIRHPSRIVVEGVLKCRGSTRRE
jgi:hypothetical protein